MQKTYTYPEYAYEQSDEQRAGVLKRHPVVIIGAGPMGLTQALDLAQRGVPAVLLDDNNTVSVGSRAVCYAKRSLEVWDRLGVGEDFTAAGVKWKVGKVFFRDELAYGFDLLPETQIAPMARIQIARDASMAQTVEEALRPGQTVVLVAGGGHVLRSLGVPTHWSSNIVSKVALAQAGQALTAINSDADAMVATPAPPAKDHCAELRKQWAPRAPAPSASQ